MKRVGQVQVLKDLYELDCGNIKVGTDITMALDL